MSYWDPFVPRDLTLLLFSTASLLIGSGDVRTVNSSRYELTNSTSRDPLVSHRNWFLTIPIVSFDFL
jgi:hypothetical protein